MLKIAVLVSGGGTNLQAIIDAKSSGFLDNVTIEVVLSSNDKAFAIERAKAAGIDVSVIARREYSSISEYDSAIISVLEKYAVDLVVMAGFMVIVGSDFINRFINRIINVHPSLIPAFCGDGNYGIIVHEKALEYGAKITGATIHFVEEKTDAGPIIMQKAVEIREDDTPKTLQARVMQEAEWIILPRAIKLIADGRVAVCGRSVKISDEII